MEKFKKILTLISIALISSFIYSIFGVFLTQIINGVSVDIRYTIQIFPHQFASIFPYFFGWVPLSLLIEKVIRINGYFFKLITYCFVGFISLFIYGVLLNLGNINFLSVLTYSLIFGIAIAFVFFNTMILYKAVFNKEWKLNTKMVITSFIFASAVIALGALSLNVTNTGDYSNERLEEYHSIEELQMHSPLSFKLPSYLPDGVYFTFAQLYQDPNEISITISYSANEKEFDLNTLMITVADYNMKNELLERHDKLDEIFINWKKGFIGRTAIVGDFKYTDVQLMWGEDEIYYSVSSDVHKNSILDEDELFKIAKSFK